MEFFHPTNKQSKRIVLLWCFLLSLSLLCVQGAKLHVHDLDHRHHHGQIHAIDGAGDHAHLSKAHFAHDTSHGDHHNDVISEVDISPDGVLKNTNKNANNSPFTLALFIFFFTLAIFVASRRLIQRCREGKLTFHQYYVLSPPLRAPPHG